MEIPGMQDQQDLAYLPIPLPHPHQKLHQVTGLWMFGWKKNTLIAKRALTLQLHFNVTIFLKKWLTINIKIQFQKGNYYQKVNMTFRLKFNVKIYSFWYLPTILVKQRNAFLILKCKITASSTCKVY